MTVCEGYYCPLILERPCVVATYSLFGLILSPKYDRLCLERFAGTASGSNWCVQNRPLPPSREIVITVLAFNDKRSAVPGCLGVYM